MAAHRLVTLEAAAGLVAPGARVLLGATGGLPHALLHAVRAQPDLWQRVTLTGAFIPGINDDDLTAVGTDTRVETIFATRGLRGDRVAHLPMHYSGFWQRLARPGVVDAVVVTVPPPRADGTVGLGVTSDFAPGALAAGALAIGVVNPAMPDVADGPRWPVARFAALAEGEAALAPYDPGPPDAAARAIAGHVLGLLRPGDTLQLGLGKLQGAVLEALAEAAVPDLGFHAGMISGPMLPLLHAGRFARGVTTGVAVGPEGFAPEVARLPGVRFAPVGETHAQATLARLPGLLAVNSCLEVDLTGQANAEALGGRQISGQGGLVDFLRGARASSGGRGVLALQATARARSRIVARLARDAAVSVARADVDYVITEFGVADLREASLAERAERLVAIAAPAHRDALWVAWEDGQRQARGGGA